MTAGRGSKSRIALACLLIVAQWTGLTAVLCVSGTGHVQVESLYSPCCAPGHAREAGMYAAADDGCAGCTDISMQNASAWDPPRRGHAPGAEAAEPVVDPAASPLREEAADAGPTPAPARPPVASAPLRC